MSTSLIPAAHADEEVDRIVDVSRPRNAGLDVTGALLFTGARFLQLLEGPASGVKALQDSIFKDLRHHKLITISNHDVSERQFSDWALAYAGPSRLVAKVVDNGITESEQDPGQGTGTLIDLLRTFSSHA